MSEIEGFEEWGQTVSLTRCIHDLLTDYTDGVAVPKELIQNADDAGATEVKLLFDERQNNNYRTGLIDQGMAECQGPALWAYNDAYFTDNDFENIIKLSGATKEDDLTKIGKFGLGFCAVYNLTDVPSFISGSKMVILDPHRKHLRKALRGSQPGLKIDLKNQAMLQRLDSQFKPFNGVFGCDLASSEGTPSFQGTLFRLPLRTANQASTSEISSISYSSTEMAKLFKMLMEIAGNLLMFTQNVKTLKLYHLSSQQTDPSTADLLLEVNISTVSCMPRKLLPNIVKHMSKVIEDSKIHKRRPDRCTQMSTRETVSVVITEKASRLCNVNTEKSTLTWILSWSSGSDKSLDMALETGSRIKGALPLACVAVPVEEENGKMKPMDLESCPMGYYKTGHIFCFLPLPIPTSLPVHVHGGFAITRDRKQLCYKTEDEKDAHAQMWNECLLADAVCNAYIYLCEAMKEYNVSSEYTYHQYWPSKCDKMFSILQKQFFSKIALEHFQVFNRQSQWTCMKNALFLDPDLLSVFGVGQIAFKALVHFRSSHTIIEMPKSVAECFGKFPKASQVLQQQIVTTVGLFQDLIFPNIMDHYWKDEERNELVMLAIDSADDMLQELLTNHACIPTEPDGSLRLPQDLVHPSGNLANLFSLEDGRFPQGTSDTFCAIRRLTLLTSLGMMTDTLSDDLLLDRARSILPLSTNCVECGMDRCSNLLRVMYYRSKKLTSCLPAELQNIKFLPVMPKPKSWPFLWTGQRGEEDMLHEDRGSLVCKQKSKHTQLGQTTFLLEVPSNLYMPSCMDLVGCKSFILHKDILFGSYASYVPHSMLLGLLGVKDADKISLEQVKEQLLVLCQTDRSTGKVEKLGTTTKRIYRFLEARLVNNDEMMHDCIQELHDKPVIFVDSRFVKPRDVAFTVLCECRPHMYRLSSDLIPFKSLFKGLGVQNEFPPLYIAKVLMAKRDQFGNTPLTKAEAELVSRLIMVLASAMRDEKFSHDKLKAELGKDNLLALDVNGTLTSVANLYMDDSSSVRKSQNMSLVSEKVNLVDAETLGIKTKKRRRLQEYATKMHFGQNEALTTRLHGILKDYPADGGILKELLQNADDAGATEIHFITDFRQHPIQKIFEEAWAPLQGPALCVYTDSAFTKENLDGIQSLGIGSKSEDPSKTGRFGIGFNAVYHLTDAPSFFTKGPEIEPGGTLCVFDPHCRYITDATPENPGMRFTNMEELRESEADVFSCYLEEELPEWNNSDHGTMFRFPLRDEAMAQQSEISKEVMVYTIANLVKTFQDEVFDALLFVNSIRRITLSNITTSGQVDIQYQVVVNISDEDERQRSEFTEYIRDVAKSVKDSQTDVRNLQQRGITYPITVTDNHDKCQKWLICEKIDFSLQHLPSTVLKAYKDKELGLLPLGGVAIPIYDAHIVRGTSSYNTGKAYCSLQLPLETGLPVHVNGHFALDHSRRNLWRPTDRKNDEDHLAAWNDYLIKHVIAPVYTSAITSLKNTLTLEHGIGDELQLYHACFPMFKCAEDKNWKLLTKAVFEDMLNTEAALFPVVAPKENTLQIDDWMPLKQAGSCFSAVFNNLQEKFTSSVSDGDHISGRNVNTDRLRIQNNVKSLSTKLTEIGLKLLSSPISLFESMVDAGIDVRVVSPDFVIRFLKSLKDLPDDSPCSDRCLSGKIVVPISDTTIKDIDSLQLILEYCMKSDKFQEEIDGLPLLLTNDNKLRVFTAQTPVFCSDYCDLLPESDYRFLHHKLVSLLSIYEGTKVLADFDIEALSDMLQYTLPYETYYGKAYSVPWEQESKQLPNKQWIRYLWKFLNEKVVSQDSSDNVDRELETNKKLKVLQDWCLVPAQRSTSQKQVQLQHMLVPVRLAYTVLDMHTFFTEPLRKAVDNLHLPEAVYLDIEKDIVIPLPSSLMSFFNNPATVLSCLCYHRQSVTQADLSAQYCHELLQYFNSTLSQLQSRVPVVELKQQLRSLPFYVTLTNHRISLEQQDTVLVLPTCLPPNGIREWADRSEIVLLQNNDNLKELHEFLSCSPTSVIDVYCSHIFCNFENLPPLSHVDHITYIKNDLLRGRLGEKDYNDEQQRLIHSLKNLPFIAVGNIMRKASELYDRDNNVFKQMLEETSFPPDPYCQEDWKRFMILIGLRHQVTKKQFIDFATQVEEQGARHDTTELRTKSEVLVTHLFEREKLQDGLLHDVVHIRFLVPDPVKKKLSDICKQVDRKHLIAFSESVSSRYEHCVWTSSHLLPWYADPEQALPKYAHCSKVKKIMQLLNIHNPPHLGTVIQHVQNVCDSLQECFTKMNKSDQKHPDHDLIEYLMNELYEYLLKHGLNSEEVKRQLQDKPIVYIDNRQIFIQAQYVVSEMQENHQIVPYLMAVPARFSRYQQLFQHVGAAKAVTADHYAKVLHSIHQKLQDDQWNANELKDISKAVCLLFCFLEPELVNPTFTQLYLPSREDTLVKSTELVVSNRERIFDRIPSTADLRFFAGFEELELHIEDLDKTIKTLPECVRPALLSDLLKEELTAVSRAQASTTHISVKQLQRLLQSDEFLEGILRLVKHNERSLDNSAKEEIAQHLQNVVIQTTEEVITQFVYRGNPISGSNQSKHCYYETFGDNFAFYFKPFNDYKSWFEKARVTLSKLINRCTKRRLGHHILHVVSMFHYIDNPEGIEKMLDDENICSYTLTCLKPKSSFPDPGAYVPLHLHFLLDSSFVSFEPEEYVAFEVSDPALESDAVEDMDYPPVYMYAIVREKLKVELEHITCLDVRQMLQRYKIDVFEDDTQVVQAGQLFKFHRHENESREMVPSDTIPGPTQMQPLTEAFRQIRRILREAWELAEQDRKRILKRLYLKWHPDKTPENEKYCTHVMQYILDIVSRLERGETISDDESDDASNASARTYSGTAYGSFFAHMDRQSAQNRTNYNESQCRVRSGAKDRSPHSTAYHTNPQPGEAIRFLKQAKLDLAAAANDKNPQIPAFNWTCYKCHQAAEKAMKALLIHHNGNDSNRLSHNLISISSSCDIPKLSLLSHDLEQLIGNGHSHSWNRTRYPDSVANGQIPGNLYTEETADKAISLAGEIIHAVQEKLQRF